MRNKAESRIGRAFGEEFEPTRGGWFAGFFLPEGEVGRSERLGLAIKELKPGTEDPSHTHNEKVEVCANIGETNWLLLINGEQRVIGPGEAMICYPGVVNQFVIPKGGENVLVLVAEAPSVHDKVVFKDDIERSQAIDWAKKNQPRFEIINFRGEAISEKGIKFEFTQLEPGRKSDRYQVAGDEALLVLSQQGEFGLPVEVNGDSLELTEGQYLFAKEGDELSWGELDSNAGTIAVIRIQAS